MNAHVKTRRLKISYGYHSNSTKKRPAIRLCGDYLSKMDFKIGDMVDIEIHKEFITIIKNQKCQK